MLFGLLYERIESGCYTTLMHLDYALKWYNDGKMEVYYTEIFFCFSEIDNGRL